MMYRASAGILVLLVHGCASTSTAPPCGGSQPLGCSIPTAVLVVSQDYEAQACDTEFLDNMKTACSGFKGLGMLDPEEFAKCQFAAKQTYEAVRTHGEKHFRSATSTYCAYR
jgi:hypothetical protein